MTNLLLWISAVDRALLARAPRETAKYVGIGGAVLMMATLAGISMSYALVVALHLHVLAVVLGVLWGLAILNLDRWIITATKRQGRWYADIANAAPPRLVLAIVIGAVISEPLVLRVFQGEIALKSPSIAVAPAPTSPAPSTPTLATPVSRWRRPP